jgi:hypothetical protein
MRDKTENKEGTAITVVWQARHLLWTSTPEGRRKIYKTSICFHPKHCPVTKINKYIIIYQSNNYESTGAGHNFIFSSQVKN